ncbi:MAG: hypothetical protein IJK87_12795 [Prevotella sp.]|nr:hypothetical protein [Prevotella sp.]
MKQLLVLLLFLCSTSVIAQDVIVKKDGSHIECKVVEVNDSGVVYKKWSNLNGNNFEIDRSDVSSVNYSDGKKVTFSEANNLYKPGNQNDGTQKLNDNALLALDQSFRVKGNPERKAKTFKTIGWVGGSALAAFGVVLIAADDKGFFGFNSNDETLLGIGFVGLGAVWTTSFLLAANHQKKMAQILESSAIYQYDFKLSNGTSLSAGLDMIHDHSVGERTLGLGLRYNF